MEIDSTTPLDEDVVIDDQPEVEEQVEVTEELTDESDYDKAWESTDTENPSEGLFGDTNVDTTETPTLDKPDEIVADEVPNVEQTGLMIKNPVLKYKGRDVPIDSEEEAINLMQKGFKLESEMSKIKPMKGMISILQDGNISVEDLTTFKDALGGNEGAKSALASRLGLQSKVEENNFFNTPDDQPEKKETYKPEVKTEDPVSGYFAELTENKPEVAGKVSQVYSDIDDAFKLEVYTSDVFPMFASSIESGEFDRVYPLAIKMKMNNAGLTWLQAYQMAGQGQKGNEKATVPPESAKIPKGGSSQRTTGDSYDRAFNMDTKDLEAKLFG